MGTLARMEHGADASELGLRPCFGSVASQVTFGKTHHR